MPKRTFTDEDGIKASELEAEFAAMNGWDAESDAASLLNGLGIGTELHYETMKNLNGPEKGQRSFWPRRSLAARTSCSWTSPPTTWTWTPSPGWRSSLSALTTP